MRNPLTRAMVSLFIGVATLAGCMGPTSTRSDLDRVANEMLDLAEATLPAIAESLGATLTEARSFAERGGGTEGSTPRVWFTVHGTMAGPEPTQAELEQALIDAGYAEILSLGNAQPSDRAHAIAISTDGTAKVSIGYSAPGDPHPGLGFDIRNVDALGVSSATVEDFRETFPRDFDQSLVREAPELTALKQLANENLDLAEATLPALAENLGASITNAQFTVFDDDKTSTTPSVLFIVDGTMDGAMTTQAELEQALIDAGYPEIVSRSDTNPFDYPYARAISADGTMKISIDYSGFVDSNSGIFFYLQSVTAVVVSSDAALEDFRTTFTREFDQSLVHEAPE